MFPEYLQDIGKECNSRPKQYESNDIERMRRLFTIIWQVQIHQNQADNSHRNIQEKDRAPVEIIDDNAAGHGTQHRTNQPWDSYKAHGAHELKFWESTHERKTAQP